MFRSFAIPDGKLVLPFRHRPIVMAIYIRPGSRTGSQTIKYSGNNCFHQQPLSFIEQAFNQSWFNAGVEIIPSFHSRRYISLKLDLWDVMRRCSRKFSKPRSEE